jgi:hypothetical protein
VRNWTTVYLRDRANASQSRSTRGEGRRKRCGPISNPRLESSKPRRCPPSPPSRDARPRPSSPVGVREGACSLLLRAVGWTLVTGRGAREVWPAQLATESPLGRTTQTDLAGGPGGKGKRTKTARWDGGAAFLFAFYGTALEGRLEQVVLERAEIIAVLGNRPHPVRWPVFRVFLFASRGSASAVDNQ